MCLQLLLLMCVLCILLTPFIYFFLSSLTAWSSVLRLLSWRISCYDYNQVTLVQCLPIARSSIVFVSFYFLEFYSTRFIFQVLSFYNYISSISYEIYNWYNFSTCISSESFILLVWQSQMCTNFEIFHQRIYWHVLLWYELIIRCERKFYLMWEQDEDRVLIFQKQLLDSILSFSRVSIYVCWTLKNTF